MNYQTGEILAMVSKPDYDPGALTTRQSGVDESGSGYLNRALQGQYPPGSTFKIVTLAPRIGQSSFRRRTAPTSCDGLKEFGNGKVTCYGGAVHGKMSLLEAFDQELQHHVRVAGGGNWRQGADRDRPEDGLQRQLQLPGPGALRVLDPGLHRRM